MRTLDGWGSLIDIADADMSAYITEKAHVGAVSFAPGELSRFVYPDAASFLREKENAVTIITFGDPLLQELKVKSALHGIPRISVIYTGDQLKGTYLAPHTHLHRDAVAVDDLTIQLESYAAECPQIGLYEIRREGEEGDGRWPVIHTLSELPNTLE